MEIGFLDSQDAVLVGPGLSDPALRPLIRRILERRKGPLVVDADGLNALAADGRFPPPSIKRVWTPHPGEFARLTGESPRGDDERVAAAEDFVGVHGGVLVLKGHRTVVMEAGRYGINETGNPGMATAGAGDVLAGMIAAFLGQGMAPFAAARAAVHIHGLAGDLAAAEKGEVSLVAGDLVDFLPLAIRRYSQEVPPCRKG
jgi:NAD(P)H-hydrate epimerase